MVMASVLFQLLRARQPQARIDVLAPGWSLPLLARMPEVNQGIEMPVGHGRLGLRTRWQLARSLRGRYDQAIVLPGSLKSALVPWLAGIARRTGYRGEQRYGLLNDMRQLRPAELPLMVQRYAALALDVRAPVAADLPAELPRPRLRVERARQAALRADLGLDARQPAVALLPGAEFGPSKQWPLAHYAAAARSLLAQGHAVWVLGSPKDAEAGRLIAEQAPGTIDLCGRTRLEDAVGLLAAASGCISNDSGLMHVAAALDVPLVALFGSTSPEHTPPLSPAAQVLRLGLDCAPCFQRTCPLGHHRCLRDISPAQVLAALAPALPALSTVPA
ncbi:MAG: lipopolysaccharide heptosyltransferase II [Burkholderiaceae bacterium]|nr:MAG: lipopolysaccharide heptosyltransferase II [Burkholderiaceae bacterium]